MYDLLQNVIRILPFVVLISLFVCLNGKKWYWRSFFVVVVGWVAFAVSTNVYWWYSFNYAPNEYVRTYVALKDGAPRIFGTFFGWAIALIFLFVAEIARALAIFGSKFFKLNGK